MRKNTLRFEKSVCGAKLFAVFLAEAQRQGTEVWIDEDNDHWIVEIPGV